MTLSQMFRVPEHERLKTALLLAPFAMFFVVIGAICGIDYLRDHHYSGPPWVIHLGIVAEVHLASSALVYLARWHRCRSHVSVQGTAFLITFGSLLLAAFVFVLIFGIH